MGNSSARRNAWRTLITCTSDRRCACCANAAGFLTSAASVARVRSWVQELKEQNALLTEQVEHLRESAASLATLSEELGRLFGVGATRAVVFARAMRHRRFDLARLFLPTVLAQRETQTYRFQVQELNAAQEAHHAKARQLSGDLLRCAALCYPSLALHPFLVVSASLLVVLVGRRINFQNGMRSLRPYALSSNSFKRSAATQERPLHAGTRPPCTNCYASKRKWPNCR